MEGSSHNAGSFFGSGFPFDGSSPFGSGFPFDGSSPFGSGFPFGGSNQSGNWNGGVTTVKLIVFKEGMLVEGSGYNSEYVKTLSINGGVSFATIYGNNIKLTEYWMKTKIIINGNEVQYSEGVTNINGGSKILKGSVVECSVNGGVSNITTNKQKYVFNHRNPNMPIRQKLNINGGITHLEMHIADAESDNYIKINGGISNAEINGMGTDIGKEEITNDTNTVEISTYGGGGYRNGETEIIIEGNSLSIAGGVSFGGGSWNF
uniref:Lipoprotein n=1 Tax=Meloidogyne hapla TaxID=6305 RepID=A0A1I8BW15_MELHA